jgi:Resolvase, N terminal domain
MDICRLEVEKNATTSCVNGQLCSCGHPRKCGHVQEIRHDHTRPHSLVSQEVNRTGALRQFVSRATRLKLPSGLWLTPLLHARCERPCRRAAEQRDELAALHRLPSSAWRALTLPHNMPLFGYARVSTRDQELAAQDAELMAAGCAKVFREKISGAKTDRPELVKGDQPT